MSAENETKRKQSHEAVVTAVKEASALAGRCTQCTCTGWQADPNDPAICIAPRPPQGRCQHSVLFHP